jgi:hypothetical protein
LQAWLLLFFLSLAIIPLESFHTHHEETVVCHQAGTHVEKVHFECELCDFVLPVIDQKKSQRLEVFYSRANSVERHYSAPEFSSHLQIPFLRGPPLIA